MAYKSNDVATLPNFGFVVILETYINAFAVSDIRIQKYEGCASSYLI